MNTVTAGQTERQEGAWMNMIVVLFLMGMTFFTLGWPNWTLAISFLGANPTPQIAGAFVGLIIWVSFACMSIYAVLSTAGAIHQTWTTYQRTRGAQITVGLLGLAILGIGIFHGQSVHPGSLHGVIGLVKS